jgi:MFS family permease
VAPRSPLTGLARVLRVHPAWIVAAVTFLALISAAAFRSSTGVLIEPVEREFGWSREATSSAISLNLILYGLTAPFAAALMERFGVRRVCASALVLVAAGTGLTLLMSQVWQLIVLWGLVVGLGSGSMALVFGAIVANRWFVRNRGLVMGVFSAGSATGQLVILPVVAWLAANVGWRWSAALVAGLSLALAPLVLLLLRDRPQEAGVQALGAAQPDLELVVAAAGPEMAGPVVAVQPEPRQNAARVALAELRRSSSSLSFWVLFGTFFVCGWSTNGLIQTHFIAAAHDHGMPPTTAASLLALIGVFDIIGTVASGWLSDRIDPRILLFAYYGLRGMSLLAAPSLLSDRVSAPLMLFVVFYGLDWVATVPPTVALCRTIFGVERSGVVFGWVFAGHMIGAGVAAQVAGTIREATGTYSQAWWLAGLLCVVAAFTIWLVQGPRPPSRPEPELAPASDPAMVGGDAQR